MDGEPDHSIEARETGASQAARDVRAPTVLQVLPALVTGGVERGTVDIAEAVVQAGGRAIVASAGGPMVTELTRAHAEHVVLPLDSKNPVVVFKNIARLAELIVRERQRIKALRNAVFQLCAERTKTTTIRIPRPCSAHNF